MRRMAVVAASVIVLAACTSTGSAPSSGAAARSSRPSPPPSSSGVPTPCHGVVSRYRLRYVVDPTVPEAVAAEVGRDTETARSAYPIETSVCGRGRVRTVVSARTSGEVAANTRSNGDGTFTIHIWTGGPPWQDAPAGLRPLILLHEWYHVVQFSFLDCTVGTDPCLPGSRLPLWLLEGSAQYEAERIGGAMGIGGGYEARRATEIREAALVPTSLRRLRPVTGSAYGLAFAAVELLVARAGHASLVRFWRLTRRTGTWRSAFRTAFGSSVVRFEAAFERYRAAGFRL
jgi:hypothetical protein